MNKGLLLVVAMGLFPGCASIQQAGREENAPQHPAGVFLGTFADPHSVRERLQGRKIQVVDPACGDTRTFVVGGEGCDKVSPLSSGEFSHWRQNHDVVRCKSNAIQEGGRIQQCERERLLIDPMTGLPFPAGTLYFAPGNPSRLLELGRVTLATITGLESWRNAKASFSHDHFAVLYCHSNGCTEAERMIKHHLITADRLIQMGTPWGSATPTFLPDTVTATVSNYGDPIPLIQIVRLFHIPFVEFPMTRFEQKLKDNHEFVDQYSRNTADIVVRPEGHFFVPHGVTLYFDAIWKWKCQQRAEQGFVDDGCEPKQENTEIRSSWWHCSLFNPDIGCPSVRREFPMLVDGSVEFDSGLVVQHGMHHCAEDAISKERVHDCSDDHYYVNYKFSDFSYDGLGMKNVDAAKTCGEHALAALKTANRRTTFMKLVGRCNRDGEFRP